MLSQPLVLPRPHSHPLHRHSACLPAAPSPAPLILWSLAQPLLLLRTTRLPHPHLPSQPEPAAHLLNPARPTHAAAAHHVQQPAVPGPLLTPLHLGHQARLRLGLDTKQGHQSPHLRPPRAFSASRLPPRPCRCKLTADMHPHGVLPCLGRLPASLLTGQGLHVQTCWGMHTLSCSWV